MTDVTDSVPGADPDRASFAIALHAARDQVIQAAGVITAAVVDLVGTIGHHIRDCPEWREGGADYRPPPRMFVPVPRMVLSLRAV
ncbi:MAG: transposase family protein [Dactylosporangium sp.]|nr:transposase family protein [Dactylosporangium sp.]